MKTLLDIFFGLMALVAVLGLYEVGRNLRTGLEKSEWYDEN